jgi:hypothetical protein
MGLLKKKTSVTLTPVGVERLADLENTAYDLQDSLVGHHLPESGQCTLCGEALTLPYIFWFGATPVAYHLRCLEHLLPSLQRDINEFYLGRQKANELHAAEKKKLSEPLEENLLEEVS